MATGAPLLWKASPLTGFALTSISAGEVFQFSAGDRAKNLPPFLLTRLDTNCAYLFVLQRDWKILNFKEEHSLQSYLWIGGTCSQVAPRRESIPVPSKEELPFAIVKVYENAWEILQQMKNKLEAQPDHPRRYTVHLSVELQYQESLEFLDMGRNPIFNEIFLNYVDDDQLRALALPDSQHNAPGLHLGFEIFKPRNVEHGLRVFKVHELRHYRPGQAHSGVVQLDLVQKLATLGPGSLNYLNRIKDMLLRGYGISKVLPFTKHLPPEPYTIDIHSLYSHPFSALAEPTDFSSFYYCCFNFAETQELTHPKDQEEQHAKQEEKKDAEEGEDEEQPAGVAEELIRSRLSYIQEGAEGDAGGRSRAFQQLEQIYDESELAMHERQEGLHEGKLRLASVYPVLKSNRTALYRVHVQKTEQNLRNRVREMFKRQAIMTGRFLECESETTRITLKEMAVNGASSIVRRVGKELMRPVLLKGFEGNGTEGGGEPVEEKTVKKLKYELLDPCQSYVFNTRDALYFWSGKGRQAHDLKTGLAFLEKLNWQSGLVFTGSVKDLHSEMTVRRLSIQESGSESTDFLGYFQSKRNHRVFEYLMLLNREGEKLKKPERKTIAGKPMPAAAKPGAKESFSGQEEPADQLKKQLTADFLLKRQSQLPCAFPLIQRYPLFEPKAQIKITYETDKQWKQRYQALSIEYAPRDIFHPTAEQQKGLFLSRIGGSMVDSLAVFEVNLDNKFRKLEHKDIGRFDANRSYFVIALIKETVPNSTEQRTNAVIYLWRGENAAQMKDAGSAVKKFHQTEFKELASKDKMIGVKRQSTVNRLSRPSAAIRPSIRLTIEQLENKNPTEDIASQLGIQKDLASQLHPALLQGALQQKKDRQSSGPIVSVLTPVSGSQKTSSVNLEPQIDQNSVDISMRTIVAQDHEPMHFSLLFRGELVIRTNDYGLIENDGIMFQLLGQPYISQRAREVPVTYAQLSSAGLFFLITPEDAAYFWIGREYYNRILVPQLEAAQETAKKLGKTVELGIEHLVSYKLFQRICGSVTNFVVSLEELRVTLMLEGGETGVFLEYMQATPAKQEADMLDELVDDKMFDLKPTVAKTFERRILPLYSSAIRAMDPPSAPRFYCIFREGEVMVPQEGLTGGVREEREEEAGLGAVGNRIMQMELEKVREEQFYKRSDRFNLGRTSLEVGCIVKGADEGCIFLVDVGSEVFVWVGSRVSSRNKPYAMPLALHLLREIETQQRKDLNAPRPRLFVRKNSGEHERLDQDAVGAASVGGEEEESAAKKLDLEGLRAERVAVNLINSGYEPVLFLKLIGVGQTE